MFKYNVGGLFLFIIIACCAFCEKPRQTKQVLKNTREIAVMSFNIRMNYKDDGPNNWIYRRDWDAEIIQKNNIDFVGIQEAYYPQYNDLKEKLTDYGSFGSVEGRQGAESEAIFYNKSKYTLVDSGTFWLSETPKIKSIGWDASLRRAVTWGKFEMKIENREIFIFNTQFGFKGKVAREESPQLLLRKINEIAGDSIAFITGDFNFKPTSKYYEFLVNGTDKLALLFDTYKFAEKKFGPSWTMNDFGKLPVEKRHRIDYIFSNKKLSILTYLNIYKHRGKVFPSDHNPIMITTKLN